MEVVKLRVGLLIVLMATAAFAQLPEEARLSEALHFNDAGVAQLNSGRLAEAIESFKKSLQLSKHPRTYFNLGTAHHQLQQFDEAIAALREATALEPNYAAGHNQLGVAYADAGRLDLAVVAFRRSLNLNPNSALTLYNLGCAQMRLRSWNDSLRSLTKSAQLNPTNAETELMLAVVLAELGRYHEAILRAERSHKLEPTDNEITLLLGTLHLRRNNKEAALAQYTILKQNDRRLANALYEKIYEGRVVRVAH